MGEKALWPAVAAVGIVCATVFGLLSTGIDVTSVLAVFGLIASVAMSMVSLMLYGKVQRIEQNTNGTASDQLAIIRDLLQHTKRSVPLDAASKVEIEVSENPSDHLKVG
jgi:high-affinity Fe2+/Pb2+ permease